MDSMGGRGGRMVGPRGPNVPVPVQAGLLRGPSGLPWNAQTVQVIAPAAVVQGGGGGAAIEHKLQAQQAEIQRLMTDNQRFAATHVALRQELAASQADTARFQQMLGEKDLNLRSLLDKSAKMDAELRNMEPLKQELQATRAELQNFHNRRQEADQAASQQIQALSQEAQKMRSELQHVPAMKQELDGLRQELQRARAAIEFEKKANMDHVEQRQAMEKNLVAMARDTEKLRAELTVARNARPAGGQFGGGLPGQDGSQRPAYTDSYGVQTGGLAGTDSSAQYGGQMWSQPAYGVHGQEDVNKPVGGADPYAQTGAYGSGSADPALAYGSQAGNAYSRPPESTYPGVPVENTDTKAADLWTEHQSVDGKTFYFNSQTGDSVWEKPQALLDREAAVAAAAAAAAAATSAAAVAHPPYSTQMLQQPQQQDHLPPSGIAQPPAQYMGGTGGPSGAYGAPSQGFYGQPQPQQPPQGQAAPLPQAAGMQGQYGQQQQQQPHFGGPPQPQFGGAPPGQGQQPPQQPQQPSEGMVPYGGGPGMGGQIRPQGPPLGGPGATQQPLQSPQHSQHPAPGQMQGQPGQMQGQPGQMQGQRPPHPQQGPMPGGPRPGNNQPQQPSPHVSARPILNSKPPAQEPAKSPPVNAPRDGPDNSVPAQGAGATLFVFGIPEDYVDQKLGALFAPYGKVLSAKVEMEHGRSRGFGFVSLDSAKAADAAIQALNGQTVAGRRLKVQRKRGEHDQQQQPQQQQGAAMGGGPGPNRWRQGQEHPSYRPY